MNREATPSTPERHVYRIGVDRAFCTRIAESASLDEAKRIAEEGAPVVDAERNDELARIPGDVTWSIIESGLVATLPTVASRLSRLPA